MKDTGEIRFQEGVTQYLSRHRSILDVQSKLSETTARISRALAYAVCRRGAICKPKGRRAQPWIIRRRSPRPRSSAT